MAGDAGEDQKIFFATFCFHDDDDEDDDDDDDDRLLQSLILVRLLVTNFITRAPLFISLPSCC